MRGVIVRKATVINEDKRRKIISILNGELTVKDIHILFMKSGDEILGNHYHQYAEVCYCLKGKCLYKLKHEITGETMEVEINEGDIMFRDAFVTHTCKASEDCILLDGAEKSWVTEDWNHYKSKDGDLM